MTNQVEKAKKNKSKPNSGGLKPKAVKQKKKPRVKKQKTKKSTKA